MDITITPGAAAVIQKKVAEGRFANAGDVVEAAVMLLDERDRHEYLRGLMLEAERQMRDGEVVEWTGELERQLQREAEEMVRLGVSPDPDVCP